MSNFTKGIFCISIDLEFAWGVWDHVTPQDIENVLQLKRPICARLIALFEKYEIPATWATVAGLLEKQPTTPPQELLAWFAPETVTAVAQAKFPQELGSHSFAHIYFDENPEAKLAADLQHAKELHQKFGFDFRSFVFPRNKVAQTPLLANAGIKIFRSLDTGWQMQFAKLGKPFFRIANLLEKLLPLPVPVVLPVWDKSGIIELPSSMHLMGRNGIRKLIQPWVVQRKARQAMKLAAEKKAIFHLWFHPSNFFFETDKQFEIFEGILRDFAKLRSEGKIEALSMGAIATQFSATSNHHK